VRDSLVAAVKLQELQNLMRELHAKRLEGPLDEKTPPPSGFEWEARAMWRDDMATASAPESSPYIPSDATPEQTEHIHEAFERDREERAKKSANNENLLKSGLRKKENDTQRYVKTPNKQH
jgi:hypothetical protein